MATFDDFLPDIRIEASDLFDEKVAQFLRETMIDFAVKTGCLTANAELELDAGEWDAQLEIETMATETPFKTLWVKKGAVYLPEASFNGGQYGTPTAYADYGTKLVFNKAPVESIQMTALCMVKPKHNATRFNDAFVSEYKEAINHGTLFRVCMTPGGRWFNPDMAQFHKAAYDALLKQAKAASFMRHNQYVKPARFV